MTKQEALNAMLAGNKVTHFKFEDNEYMFINKDGDIELTMEQLLLLKIYFLMNINLFKMVIL